MNKNTIIIDHQNLLNEELDRVGTILDQEKKLETLDTCFKLHKIYKHFNKLEPYLDRAIREIENEEKREREIE